MKKSMFFLLLLAIMATSCEKTKSREEYGVTTMTKLKPAECKDAHIKKVESASMDCMVGTDDVNGRDCADISEVTNAVEPPPPLRNSVKFTNPNTVYQQPTIKKMIIKDGRLGLQVTNLQTAKQQIDSVVKQLKGYYANENLKNYDNQMGYELTIRIPVVNFEKFVQLTETGNNKVLFKEISARDVTEEFVDLQTRLTSKRNALARYNEIMKKANAMKDIVQIEEAIRVLQEEIESTEGRLRYLTDCVNYSTLELTISTTKDFTYTPAKRDSFWEKLKESVVEGWFGLVDFILSLFSLWPYLLPISGFYFLVRLWFKRYKARKKAKKESEA